MPETPATDEITRQPTPAEEQNNLLLRMLYDEQARLRAEMEAVRAQKEQAGDKGGGDDKKDGDEKKEGDDKEKDQDKAVAGSRSIRWARPASCSAS